MATRLTLRYLSYTDNNQKQFTFISFIKATEFNFLNSSRAIIAKFNCLSSGIMRVVAIFIILLLFYLVITSLVVIIAIDTTIYQTANAQKCHPTLWKHVWASSRLTKVPGKECISVSGTIHSQKIEPDGDVHMLIKVDPKWCTKTTISKVAGHTIENKCSNLLTPGNFIGKGGIITSGYLVAEAICQHTPAPKYTKAIIACKPIAGTFLHKIPIPSDGTHVCITGALIHDKKHPPQYPSGWAEIHPVSTLKKC